MNVSTGNNLQNIRNNWVSMVNPLFQDIAFKLVNQVDWKWTSTPITKIPDNHLRDYQLFILAKIVSDDIEVSKQTGRSKLSPTLKIDEIWHMHLLRPSLYFNMCDIMLPNRITKIIDRTPESEADPQALKDERIKKTKEMMKFIFPSYETSSSSSSSLLPTSAVSTLFHNNVTFPPKSPSAPVVTAPVSYSSASSSSASSVLGKRSNDVEQVAIKRTSSSFSSSTTSPSSIVPVEDTTELFFGNEPDYPRMIFKIQRSQTVDYVMNHYCVNAS
jgi:hypothetical protein